MQISAVVLALAAVAAADTCASSYSSKFAISVVKPSSSKRDVIDKRAACSTAEGSLVIGLQNGVLTDEKGRTGYIASNYQFQFDGPPQANHMQVSGFGICSNNSLALDGNAVWYQCLSGNFYNLYNKNWAAQCMPVEIMAVACDGSATGSGSGSTGSSAAPSAAPQATSASAAPAPSASQISDGQPQSPSAAPQIATGAAASYGPQIILAAVGLAGAALL